MKKKKKKSFLKRLFLVVLILCASAVVLAYPAYLLAQYAFNHYFDVWGNRLVDLEKRGLLSKEFGAAWHDVLQGEQMSKSTQHLVDDGDQNLSSSGDSVLIVDGVSVRDYPSLGIIRRLNEITKYSNSIEIVDRKDRMIAEIRTDHTRGRFNEFPKTLITALTAAEEGTFFTNKNGFEFESYVRAIGNALVKSVTTLSKPNPRGTSTITQQVAKLFISDVDEEG